MTAQKSYYISATAIVIENRNNGSRNRKLEISRYAWIHDTRPAITDFEKAAMHAISQMLSVVGVLSTWANVGGIEFRPLVCQKTIDKNSAISKWLVWFFGLSLLPSDEVKTALFC